MARRSKTRGLKRVEALTHDEASRKNIPTAELQSAAQRAEEIDPFEPVTYLREDPLPEGETRPRDEDLDPQVIWKGATLRLSPNQIAQLTETGRLEVGDAQLVWRGKDQQDWSDLVVQAPPLYIQEKIHPKAIIDDLRRQSKERREAAADIPDLFADFNGIDPEAKTEFYRHDQNWQNRMILGDSLQVMASLAEREGLRGQVQCIYFDPPYGIRFNSNWQVSTRSRDVKDGKLDQITREPEQVKAFRDTWNDGVHSYLTYLRDRLTTMRDLLTESGSIFLQIGDENVHRVRAVMDEVYGEKNFVSLIRFNTTGIQSTKFLSSAYDHLIWYARSLKNMKYRQLYREKVSGEVGATGYTLVQDNAFNIRSMTSEERSNPSEIGPHLRVLDGTPLISGGTSNDVEPVMFRGKKFPLKPNSHWKTHPEGRMRLLKADRVVHIGNRIEYKMFIRDFGQTEIDNFWRSGGQRGFTGEKIYVVQTAPDIIQRAILMATDPGNLVIDPTCGSGTTAYVAELWGRRWITIDTSRVSLALARARLMGSRFPYFYLTDSLEGSQKEQDVSGKIQPNTITHGDIRQGFVYERAPHIMLRTVANNSEIDVIWENYQDRLEPLREQLNTVLGRTSHPSPPGVTRGSIWMAWSSPAMTEKRKALARTAKRKAPGRTEKGNAPGRNGKSPVTQGRIGRPTPRSFRPGGGSFASHARRKSTNPSRERRTWNFSMTALTRINQKSE